MTSCGGLGCEEFQGYLCSEPLPADQFLRELRKTTDTTASRPHRLVTQSL